MISSKIMGLLIWNNHQQKKLEAKNVIIPISVSSWKSYLVKCFRYAIFFEPEL